MCDNTLFLCNIWFLYRASFSAALKNIDFSGFSQVFLWQRPIHRGVRKTVNGAYRCGYTPFRYAIMTYGTVAGSPPWLSLWESCHRR